MNIDKNKLLIKKIEFSIQNRPNDFHNSSTSFYIFLYTLIFLTSFIIIKLSTKQIFTFLEKGYSTPEIIKTVIIFLAATFFVFHMYIRTLTSPKEKQKKDKWLWNNGRLLIVTQVIYPTLIIISLFLNLNEFVSGNNITARIYLLIILGFLFNIIFGAIIFISVINPRIIFSRQINLIGATSYVLQFVVLALIITNSYLSGITSFWFCLILFLILLYLIFKHSKPIFQQERLLLTQIYAMEIVSPYKLTELIISKNSELKQRIKAIKYIRKKYKDEEFTFLQALNKELVREINSTTQTKWNWIFAGLAIIFIFTIEAIGEGLIQDIFNGPIKEYFCNRWGLCID